MCCDFCDLSGQDQFTSILAVMPTIGAIGTVFLRQWLIVQSNAIQTIICYGLPCLVALMFIWSMQQSWTIRDHDEYHPVTDADTGTSKVVRVAKFSTSSMWAWCGKRTCCFLIGTLVWLSIGVAVMHTPPASFGPTAMPTVQPTT